MYKCYNNTYGKRKRKVKKGKRSAIDVFRCLHTFVLNSPSRKIRGKIQILRSARPYSPCMHVVEYQIPYIRIYVIYIRNFGSFKSFKDLRITKYTSNKIKEIISRHILIGEINSFAYGQDQEKKRKKKTR